MIARKLRAQRVAPLWELSGVLHLLLLLLPAALMLDTIVVWLR